LGKENNDYNAALADFFEAIGKESARTRKPTSVAFVIASLRNYEFAAIADYSTKPRTQSTGMRRPGRAAGGYTYTFLVQYEKAIPDYEQGVTLEPE